MVSAAFWAQRRVVSTGTGSMPAAVPHQALNQAAHWFAVLSSGEADADDKRRWESWLAAAPEHREAWRYVERISHRFEPIKSSPERGNAIAAYEQSHMLRRRQVLRSLGLLTGTALLGWGATRYTPLPDLFYAWTADAHTGTGELRTMVLSDGTRVWLNALSAFNNGYNDGQRSLRLLRGEILIDTASDPRPFYVQTPQGQLQALGTRFSVRLEEDQTFLAVYEGAVEVSPAATNNRAVIGAGRQVRFSRDAIANTADADPAREAWSRGLLVARHIPLSEVITELRPYFRGHLGVAPEIANLPVFGGFPLAEPERALHMLEQVLPIRVQRRWSWWISIEPA